MGGRGAREGRGRGCLSHGSNTTTDASRQHHKRLHARRCAQSAPSARSVPSPRAKSGDFVPLISPQVTVHAPSPHPPHPPHTHTSFIFSFHHSAPQSPSLFPKSGSSFCSTWAPQQMQREGLLLLLCNVWIRGCRAIRLQRLKVTPVPHRNISHKHV